MNDKSNPDVEKCIQCGKEKTDYFGFCSYTCWKENLDKPDNKPNCPVCGFKMCLNGQDAKPMYRCGKCNYSNWKNQIMNIKCNGCDCNLGHITNYELSKEVLLKLQEPIYCEKCTLDQK